MLPLEGITVIAVEQAVAAPFCSSRLADAGAHVIKVERPEGDFARGYDAAAKGQSSYFVWLNRGKDSVVIDLATKEGRGRLEDLISKADVLIQNLKPGSMDKLGFALERLKKDYPALISCTISGYGDDGPYADRKAYDLLIQAESGLASITGGFVRAGPINCMATIRAQNPNIAPRTNPCIVSPWDSLSLPRDLPNTRERARTELR